MEIRIFLSMLCCMVWQDPVRAGELAFETLTLETGFYAEGATAADLNNDGHPDVVAGPFWFEGPDFRTRHEIYPPVPFDPLNYSDNFLVFPYDFDSDGWTDIMLFGFPGKDASWFRNPGKTGQAWERHSVFGDLGNESPDFVDITGDGKPEIVCVHDGAFGWAEADWSSPERPWTFHAIQDEQSFGKFTHGLGVHDLNQDGHRDLLYRGGWYEQPESGPRRPEWERHQVAFAPEAGGAQMLATDLTGDGWPEVITSKNAHGYGLSWFEQLRKPEGAAEWREHAILPQRPVDDPNAVQFSQLHALALGDMDGDGLQDIVTGKRWWAHGPDKDPEPNADAVVYVFRQTVDPQGGVRFEPHLVDSDSGLGTQVTLADLNADGRLDIVSANKKGIFVFLSTTPNLPSVR